MSEEMTKKPYRSCYYLESGISFLPHEIGFCCDRPSPLSVQPMDSAEGTIDAFLKVRDQLRRENQGENPPCAGCNLFQECEKSNGEIQYINFGVHNFCQFSCIYCELQHEGAQEKNKPENYDALKFANELKRRGLLVKPLDIACASGEITVHPKREQYYDFIEENASTVVFVSNAGKFDARIAHILSSGSQNCMLVSIDAGTEETFRKIRGVNMFKKVVENLTEYRKYTSLILLKYILLEENCGDQDLEGFIKICSALRPSQMVIAGDARKAWSGEKQYEETIVSAAVKLVEGAIKHHLHYTFQDILGPANLQEIHRRVAALPEAVSAVQQLDKALSAEKLICYGAGGNCETVLSEMKLLNLRMPDIIWDRNAQPGQTYHVCGRDVPVCRPDFNLLSGGGYGVFSTITNYDINQQLDRDMREHGFSELLTNNRLVLALMAKRVKMSL